MEQISGLPLLRRWLVVVALLLLYALLGGFLYALFFFTPEQRRALGCWWTGWISRRILQSFGIQLKIWWGEGDYFPLRSEKDRRALLRLAEKVRGHFVISNHYSYTDVIALSSFLPSVFVTSRETESDPFLGYMAKVGGSLFVERRKRTSVQADIDQLRQVLAEGARIVVFPEGTSSDGRAMLPFKKSLLEAPIRSGAFVLPVCINYLQSNGQPWPGLERDVVCYHGDMLFFPHFKRFLKSHSMRIDVHVLEGLATAGLDRKELSDLLQQKISSRFVPILDAEK
jgi:1-acyl-sn-glycerol-3-phosphate acyltransferase